MAAKRAKNNKKINKNGKVNKSKLKTHEQLDKELDAYWIKGGDTEKVK